MPRDHVRLLVARPDGVEHTRFVQLVHHLRPGDLLVVNTSATLPAALDATRADGSGVTVHVAGPPPDPPRGDDASWIVELRRPDGRGPVVDAAPGDHLELAGGEELRLVAPHGAGDRGPTRLWRARVSATRSLLDHLGEHGRPISYGYVHDRFPLDAYQTVFGRQPGSAEMVSAARPFSPQLVTELVAAGVTMATIRLHTGVSSLEASEPPQPERYRVPDHTAELVALTRRSGGRVVAVGTTVTRALESVADVDGNVRGGGGWTDLVLGPDRPARVVDGLVTGWHDADASHLELLTAVAGPELVEQAYAAALSHGYLWHEFGDSCLLLP